MITALIMAFYRKNCDWKWQRCSLLGQIVVVEDFLYLKDSIHEFKLDGYFIQQKQIVVQQTNCSCRNLLNYRFNHHWDWCDRYKLCRSCFYLTNVLVIFATAVIGFVIVTDQHRGFVAVAGLPIAIAAAAGVPLAIAVLFLIGAVASKSLICGAIVAFGPRLVFIYLNSL